MEKYTKVIRDFLDENPRVKHILIRKTPYWDQLCSSLDVIDDSSLAIEAYLTDGDNDEYNVGRKYLYFYGLWQALFLQQDATMNLSEAFGIADKIANHPILKEIRELRNDCVGHPTKREPEKGKKDSRIFHIYIARVFLKKDTFMMLKENIEDKGDFRHIDITAVIEKQKSAIAEILESIASKIRMKEKEHKEKFRMEKLTDCLPDSLNYALQKTSEYIDKRDRFPLAVINLEEIKRALIDLKTTLLKREIELDTFDIIKQEYEWLEYPIQELEKYYRNGLETPVPDVINEKTAYIFAHFVQEMMDKLKSHIQYIDKEYSRQD